MTVGAAALGGPFRSGPATATAACSCRVRTSDGSSPGSVEAGLGMSTATVEDEETMMRQTWALVALFICGGALLATGQDGGPQPRGTARDAARRLLAPGGGDAARGGREDARRALAEEYAAVRDAVLRVLREVPPLEPGAEVEFRSPLYYALQVARSWSMVAARRDLTARVTLRLRPESVPPGIDMAPSSFYPAAEALAAIAGPPELLVRAMTESNRPILLWVMTEAYGKSETVALLTSYRDTGNFDASILSPAIELAGSAKGGGDLLPPVFEKGK